MTHNNLIIIIDTREQRPYKFKNARVSTLQVGDYSIAGHETEVAIERKSHIDALGSLGKNRARFEREVKKLGQMKYGAIVIETSLKRFLIQPSYTKMNPKTALLSLLSWSIRHGVHVHFVDDRQHVRALVHHLLKKFHKYYCEESGTNECRESDLCPTSDKKHGSDTNKKSSTDLRPIPSARSSPPSRSKRETLRESKDAVPSTRTKPRRSVSSPSQDGSKDTGGVGQDAEREASLTTS